MYHGAVHVLLTELRIYSRRELQLSVGKSYMISWSAFLFKNIQEYTKSKQLPKNLYFCINLWSIYPAPCSAEIILIKLSIEYNNEK